MGVGAGSLESVGMNRSFWKGKRVFVTGHTGFKGSWLSLWLSDMGAEVHGYALTPPTDPSFFVVSGVEARLASHSVADVRDAEALLASVERAKPSIVLHLAAQSLVRTSYDQPVETYSTNVMGTVHLLDATRRAGGVRAVVNVTTDKCYENREWVRPYREGDRLGGRDPYSSSKACSELVTTAFRKSFLHAQGVHVATARAGNVIGGGDWASDRLIPDFVRGLENGRALEVRSPSATRPWQHVLEPLSGYLMLAEALHEHGATYAEEWNFGPVEGDCRTVQWVVERLCSRFPGTDWTSDLRSRPHEANALKLDHSKAKARLGWSPRWELGAALDRTLDWYAGWKKSADMAQLSLDQIRMYEG